MSTFTEHQCAAIRAQGNILVSAGAGTGKTGTVIARCLRLILEERCSIENILMVTFTEAAAAEMRARLRKALESKSSEQPGDAFVDEQLALLDTAHISTLHGFGLQLVREHFHELGLDPQVSVLDDTQTQPLIHRTLDALFEQCYAERGAGATPVLDLIHKYGGGSEDKIRSLVLKVHRYSQTLPHPARWLEHQLGELSKPEPADWRELFVQAVREWRAEFRDEVEAHNGCDNVAKCLTALKDCVEQPSFEQAATAIRCVVDAFNAEWVRGSVGRYRDPLEKFFERALFLSSLLPGDDGIDPMLEDWERMRQPMRALLELAQHFTIEFTRAKRALGGIDFADIEQLALQCLLDQHDQPTETARGWQERFAHVFVDEYQDINAAQDAIIRAVSRGGTRANRFLVGDVKQSIYRFRLADPTIFRGYEEQWRREQGGQRIPLADNFRSRERILNFVNAVFDRLMRPEIGDIHYDADAQLRFGSPDTRQLLGAASDAIARVELHVIHDGEPEVDNPDADEQNEVVDLDNVELEARFVAQRLRKLHEAGHVIWDNEEKRERAADWRDMVVLLRSPTPRIEAFAKEFSRAGVPLAAARAGFFSAIEVCDLLNVLRLLDNPRQDIPLAAVLRSPLFGFSPDELAAVRAAAGRNRTFFHALNQFYFKGRPTSDGIENAARAKAEGFWTCFERWRRLLRHTSLSRCLETILAETHYEALLLANERGRESAANVQRLLELARNYDPFQRQGLYRFLKFVDEQTEAGLDQDVASIEAGNAVRLMSIHASKGLEFPIVALACLGGQFNQMDLRQDILLSPARGLCARIVCPESDRRYPSLPWWWAKQAEQRELLGEELRLLYVAMTRARDTLLLTAFDRSRAGEAPWPTGRTTLLHARELLSARCYWDWLKLWLSCVSTPGDWHDEERGKSGLLEWRRWSRGSITEPAAVIPARKENGNGACCDLNALRARVTWQYQFQPATHEFAKSNVSALRRRALEMDEEAKHLLPRTPRVRASDELSAADVGSAHHAFLQKVNLRRVNSLVELRSEAERFVNEGWLTREEVAVLNFEALLAFWQSPDGKRMAAMGEPKVRRELPFTAKFTIDQLRALGFTKEESFDDFVVVQGVVDLACIDEEGIDVLDFKTDQVTKATARAKADEYTPQVRLYAAALHRIFAKPVRSAALHFLAAGETLPIKVK